MSSRRSVPERTAHRERVWKFTLAMPNEDGRSFVTMPAHVTPLSVGVQSDELVVWALVDPLVPPHIQSEGPRRFIVVNTGQPVISIPYGAKFLGTVTTSNGIVWHVWDGDAETTV